MSSDHVTSPSMPNLHKRRRLALPLGVQLLGILVGALVVAQLVTLALTVVIPPAPVQRWDLDAVAEALRAETTPAQFERKQLAGPPDISEAGWLVSASSRQALADKLQRPVGDVELAFHTQLPVGGVTVPVDQPQSPLSAKDGEERLVLSWLVGEAHAQGVPGGPPPGGIPGGPPGGGFPGGAPPGGRFPSGVPGGGMPGGLPPGGRVPGPGMSGSAPGAQAPAGRAPSMQVPAGQPQTGGPQAGAPAGSPPQGGISSAGGPPGAAGPGRIGTPPAPSIPTTTPVFTPSIPTRSPAETPTRSAVTPAASNVASTPAQARPATPQAAPTPMVATPPAVASEVRVAHEAFTLPTGTPQPIPFRQSEGLLSFTTPPFIEGDFIAALRQPDGSWIALAPRAEPFPNRWQQRVMLWFALSLLIVAPIAWLFARRIVKPLESFAEAAETLGRDPAATVLPLSGPAEIGRAAQAFNQMNNRLRAFVDDRTAMVGAISHDLRTPLTRLRFRLEDVPDEQRDALLREVDEMEVMISQVIAFIRDASTPGAREHVDFAELVESSVEDARMLGDEIELEASGGIPVEVDPVGMRRLLGNLLENAIKYGARARVRVVLRGEQAVAEIIDDGPGIPESERGYAFEPFFRGETARGSGKPGSGLGLAVCRSIARAHGGEVSLEQRAEGFVAAVSVPISYAEIARMAA